MAARADTFHGCERRPHALDDVAALSNQDMPWEKVHVVQVDERVAPARRPDRNLTHLRDSLLTQARLPVDRIHAKPVEASDLEAAATQYAARLQEIAGSLFHAHCLKSSRPRIAVMTVILSDSAPLPLAG